MYIYLHIHCIYIHWLYINTDFIYIYINIHWFYIYIYIYINIHWLYIYLPDLHSIRSVSKMKMCVFLSAALQGKEGRGQKSVLDVNPELQAMLEMAGKTLHSQGLREPQEDQDQWGGPGPAGSGSHVRRTLRRSSVITCRFLFPGLLWASSHIFCSSDYRSLEKKEEEHVWWSQQVLL